MKYLKPFTESKVFIMSDFISEIRDFCRNHLAYLIDEGFEIIVTPLFSKDFNTGRFSNTCEVSIYKSDRVWTDIPVEWSSIKDHFIPFLYMLNKHYDIIDFPKQTKGIGDFNIEPCMISEFLKDNYFDNQCKIRRLKIRVGFKDQSITESVDFLENIEDFCKNYLANLLDDTDYGFNIRKVSEQSGRYNATSVIFLLFNHDYWVIEWDKIKDHVIPFLHMLIREYKIESLPYYKSYSTTADSEDPRNRTTTTYRYIDDNPRNRTIRFRTGTDQYYYTSIENVINDEDVPQEFYQIQIQFY
jgi:hypothetical protein